MSAADALTADLVPEDRIRKGTTAYRNTGVALFLAGFSSFALIYCVQPLLPAFALHFDKTPAESSLSLSLTTACLAFSILIIGGLSQGMGRKSVMLTSMLLAAVLNLLAAASPSWAALLAARAVEGLVLGGVPAVAMAYLAEEIDPAHLGKAMGLYIGGTAFGAMMGRVGMGFMTEFTSWRVAMAVLGALCLAAAIGFALLLPPSRHFERQRAASLAFHLQAWRAHLANPPMRRVYMLGFCLTGVFVTVFNYVTFRLSEAPYLLSTAAISLIFLAYAFGVVSSSVAGNLSDKIGRKPLLIAAFSLILVGVIITLSASWPLICLGVVVVATGFFIGHSVASGLVGAEAKAHKGHASSLYLLFYYIGASLMGFVGGWFWEHGGWNGVAALTAVIAIAGILLSTLTRRRSA